MYVRALFSFAAISAGSVAIAQAQEAPSQEAPTFGSGPQVSVKIEPGLATALTEPQSGMTETGFRQAVKVLFGVSRYFAFGPSAAFTTLPAVADVDSSRSWAFGGTARLERPRDAPGGRFAATSPWIDADLLYVRTGPLDRMGFDAAVGVAVPLDDNRKMWFGPFVRYSQILQGDRAGYDNRDAKILSVGLSLEVGAGLASNAGCPAYDKVVVEPDKLELKEKIAFKWDSANLEDASLPLLDEVAKALKDNVGFKVQIDGNASSEGSDDYNQALSERRATAVLDYLIAHGVASNRLISKGFGSSTPTSTNTTAAGRESNRRVEFVVSFIIVEKAK